MLEAGLVVLGEPGHVEHVAVVDERDGGGFAGEGEVEGVCAGGGAVRCDGGEQERGGGGWTAEHVV